MKTTLCIVPKEAHSNVYWQCLKCLEMNKGRIKTELQMLELSCSGCSSTILRSRALHNGGDTNEDFDAFCKYVAQYEITPKKK